MAPTPDGSSPVGEECICTETPMSDDSVVISGMSALMPGCNNLDEFANKLYNMENMATGEKPRWKFHHPEAVPYHGKVPEIDRFDAQFFMIHYRLSHSCDPHSRKLLEQTYQAIIDAGVCPSELSGKRVGVFIATCANEMQRNYSTNGTGLLGSSKSLIANRISYWLNAEGPSYTLDGSWCGSMVVLEKAVDAMVHGQCDAAIVGGSYLTIYPHSSIHYRRLMPLCNDGKTKCYDANADGQNMSEAMSVIFLQKCKDARRIYAEVCHVKSEYGGGLDDEFKGRYGPYRDPMRVSKFLQEFYMEAGVSPSDVEYVEGCGAAVPEADLAELRAIEQVFCKERSKPLLVGSVTSNMGFADANSGLCGVVKLLLAYQRGKLAANLHCVNPRKDIEALQDGRMKLVTKHERFDRTYTALNNFSVTGLNAHLLLRGFHKIKDVARYHCNIPYMVVVSGRQESAVQKILDIIKANDLDPEEIALYHEIHKTRTLKHLARGYGIYSNENNKTVMHCEKVQYYDDARRPLWFVYSGMGSQWAGMGAQLMRIPIFAAAIERCSKVLKPKGVDILNIITSSDESVFDNILNSFVGIAAIQIGLTDILRAVGLVPDYIIGHSVGELGCAYADGCCTAEEMIMLSYSRGLVSTQTPFIRGSMAAVGIGYKQISKMCPPEIDIACHNGPDSSTISGPVEAMRKFLDQLGFSGIFAKEVKCSNIAYHSRYVVEAAHELLRCTKDIVKEPKLRSERWLSTSVHQNRWHEDVAKYSSAEYHTNNLLNPVLFEETLKLVPNGAVIVEIAPHGLLQAILKRSLPKDCCHVPLTRRGHQDNVLFLLQALGTLYTEGYNIDISALYPKVEFPVAPQTRQLSHIVEWVHTEEWDLPLFVNADQKYTAVYKPIVTIHDEEHTFLKGSIVEGTRIFPLAGALVFVWDTLSMITDKPLRETSVQFQNVKFHIQPVLYDNRALRLIVMLQRGSGRFEVIHENMLMVEGYISAISTDFETYKISNEEDPMILDSSDIYKLLFERGYHYRNDFRAIHSSNISLTKAKLIWQNNWVTFIDGALQLCSLKHGHYAVSRPQYIKCISIDTNSHLKAISNVGSKFKDMLLEATAEEDQNTVRCAGLSIEHVIFKNTQLMRQPVVLQALKFIPFFQDLIGDVMTTMNVFIQMVAENLNKENLIVLNIDNNNEQTVLNEIDTILSSLGIQMRVTNVKEEDIRIKNFKNPDVIMLNHSTCNVNVLEILYDLYPEAFLITIGVNVQKLYVSSLYTLVSAIGRGRSRIELGRWKSKPLSTVALTVGRPEDFQCLNISRKNLQPHQKLVIFTSYPPPNDLKNLVKQWRAEKDRNQVYLAMVNDKYRVDMKQLPRFDLAFNIYNQNTWGGEYYLPLIGHHKKESVAALRCSKLGDLNSLYWAQIHDVNQQSNYVTVKVHFAEVNVYDAKRVLAQISVKNIPDQGFGMSFSGITNSGEYVMGISLDGSVSEQICSRPDLLWPVPTHWSLEDAATVPLAYTIAFYCLGIKRRLVPGTTVLVHGGAGALGQAAISIALANDCTVFTTVSDCHKKKFITKLFPNLPENHIGNSRDDSFKDMVMAVTKGSGCHIVLSCMEGLLKHASLSCCGSLGTTFDIAQIHTQNNFDYGMSNMSMCRSYVTIDISSIFSIKNIEDFKRIQLMITEGINRGYVRPLSRVTYAPQDALRAFRLLAASRHRGRVLLRMSDDNITHAQPRLSCSPDVSHIVLCDEDGFGVNFANRLVERGVRKLYLHVLRPSNYLLVKRQLWESRGVEVRIVSGLLDTSETIRSVLEEGNRLGPIEGIYVVITGAHTTGIKETKNDMISSTIVHLDVLSRELCPKLRYFAVISEACSIANDICLKRAKRNLNALSLQLTLNQFPESTVKDRRDLAIIWSSAVDAVETALLSNETLVLAHKQTLHISNVLEEVTKIPGVSIISTMDDGTVLEQVGIDEGRAQEISTLLENRLNIYIPKDTIPYMTLGQLKNLKAQTTDIDKELPGFGGYFSYIDSDEILASCEMVLMPTLTHASRKSIDIEDFKTYLCIVPGVEGHYERFHMLCERLKLPAVVLQLGLTQRYHSVHEIAQELVEVLMKKLRMTGQFYLLGYEFGVPIVIEMAVILERYGLTGTVYCLGGSPYDIHRVFENKLQDMTEESLQIALCQHMHSLILGEQTAGLEHKLRDLPHFSDKVQYCVASVRERVPYSSQYIETLLVAAYSRIKLTRHCDMEFNPLRAKIVILRAKFPDTIPIDTCMSKLSHQAVKIHELDATLAYAPLDLNCAAIINKYLDNDILTKFNKSNRCESHVIEVDQ